MYATTKQRTAQLLPILFRYPFFRCPPILPLPSLTYVVIVMELFLATLLAVSAINTCQLLSPFPVGTPSFPFTFFPSPPLTNLSFASFTQRTVPFLLLSLSLSLPFFLPFPFRFLFATPPFPSPFLSRLFFFFLVS